MPRKGSGVRITRDDDDFHELQLGNRTHRQNLIHTGQEAGFDRGGIDILRVVGLQDAPSIQFAEKRVLQKGKFFSYRQYVAPVRRRQRYGDVGIAIEPPLNGHGGENRRQFDIDRPLILARGAMPTGSSMSAGSFGLAGWFVLAGQRRRRRKG